MRVHIALYRWKDNISADEVRQVLVGIKVLETHIPGIIDIVTGENNSAYGEGYTHVILVRAESQAAIEAYRAHPEHRRLADEIDAMEERGIGVDFEAN